jgi:hypothetical protein
VKRLNHLREPGESYSDAILAPAPTRGGQARANGGAATALGQLFVVAEPTGTVILFFSGKLGVGSWEARASLTAGRQRYRGDTFWLLGNVGLPVRPMLDIAKFIIDHINLQMTDVGHRRRGAKIQQRRSDEQPSRKRWKHEQRAKLTNSGSLEYIELTTGSPLNFCRTRQSRRGGSHRQATRLARFGPTRMHLLSLHSWLN